jgi:RHS repeat-associated protein
MVIKPEETQMSNRQKPKLNQTGKPPVSAGPKQTSISHEAARTIIENRVLPTAVYSPRKAVPGSINPPVLSAVASGFASGTVQGSESIAEMARALRNDVDAAFSFVHDNIEFLPTFGSQKGGLGALIDGMGNAFDQSELFIEILRVAGYTANFVYGELELTQAAAAAWLGTEPTDIWAASNLLGEGFIPNTVIWTGTEYKIRISHCWARVNITGTDYHFDPAMKQYSAIAGINLQTAMGYDRTTFMNRATTGATINANYVKDINRTNVRNDLNTFTANLLSYIQTNNPTASVDEILGGKKIVAISAPVRQTVLPYLRPGSTPTIWTDIPNSYKATFHVVYDDPNINLTFYSKDIHSKRLTLTFNGSLQAELRLDGALLATSSAQSPNSWNSVLLEMVHPYGSTNADQSFWMTIWADHPYLLAQAWGNAGAKMAQLHKEKLDQSLFDGFSGTDEPAIGELFSLIWHSWNAQNNRTSDITNKLSNCRTMYHHQVGVFGHYDTIYEDLPGIMWKTAALDNNWDNVKVNDNAMAMHGIAFEAAVIQQLAGIGGISTTTIIDIANTAGNKIYDGQSSNWLASVKPNLINYSPSTLTDVENWWINSGWRVAIPENGSHTEGSWTGYAYYAISPYQGTLGIIDGSLKGGTGSGPWSLSQVSGGGSEITDDHEQSGSVDLADGAYRQDPLDFVVGGGEFPFSLGFGRSYSSSQKLVDAGLGLGWSHNHQMSATQYSNGMLTLAIDSPVQGAPGLVEVFVTIDLYKDLNKPMDKWVTAALSNQWLIDRITDNAVQVQFVGARETFVKLPDGSFAQPVGVVSKLLDNGNGTLTLKTPQQVAFNYNTDGKISNIAYPSGMTVNYSYTSGKLINVTNGLGRTLTFNYTGSKLTSVTDGSRSIGFGYDANSQLQTVTNTANKVTTYEYGNPGLLVKTYLPANPTIPVVTNTYDTLNRVKEQKDAYNNIWKYFISGPTTEEEDPAANSAVSVLNDRGIAVKRIDPVNKTWANEFDGLGRVIRTIAPEGNSVEYVYDGNNNILTKTMKAKPGAGLVDIVNTFTYHPTWNKLATATDPRGKVTTFNYDSLTGNLLSTVYPTVNGLTPQVTFTYNSRGQLLTKTDPTGIVTEYTYDSLTEKLTRVTVDKGVGRLNLTVDYGYDTAGNVTSVTDSRGHQTVYEFDSERRLTKVIAPSPFLYQTKFSYNENGNCIKVERETGDPQSPWQTWQATYTYDGLVSAIIDSGNKTTSFVYESRRILSTTTDAINRVVTQGYDQAGRNNTTDTMGVVQVIRTYTENGQLASLEDARGNVTVYEYDGFDRLKKRIYQDTNYEESSYDIYGRLTVNRTRSGVMVTYQYDDLGRMIEKAPSSMPTVSFEYDLANRLKKVITAVVPGNPVSGTFEYFFDTAGRMIKEQYPDGKQVQYQLDGVSNVTRLTYPDGYYVDRVFDELDRLVDIKLNGASASALSFVYDALSRRTRLDYNNGAQANYFFDSQDNLLSLRQTFFSSSVEFNYGFNDVKELVSQEADDTQYQWSPSSPGGVSYGVANSMNQYVSVGGINYAYNSNGCLTNDGSWTFGYDSLNQLVSANNGSIFATYTYDPLLRQGKKTVGSVSTQYIYAGWRRIADYDGDTGTLQNRYVYGSGLDEPLIQINSAGAVSFFHHDRVGSVVAISDATGVVTNQYKYSAYGESSGLSGSSYGFQGQRYDSETGLYYFKHRYYSSKLGRFLQPDPIGYDGGGNLYQFANNAPTVFSDPLGLDVWLTGPSQWDPPGHMSVHLGQYGYEDTAFTYGVVVYLDPPKVIWGKQYIENHSGGEILAYKKTTNEEVLRLAKELAEHPWADGHYFVNCNCRTFSEFVYAKARGEEVRPPVAPVEPWRWNPFDFTVWPAGGSSGNGSGGNGGGGATSSTTTSVSTTSQSVSGKITNYNWPEPGGDKATALSLDDVELGPDGILREKRTKAELYHGAFGAKRV